MLTRKFSATVKRRIKQFARPFVKMRTGNWPRILMYHRFSKAAKKRSCSQELFRWHVQYLAKSYQFLSMSELVRTFRSGGLGKQRYAVITVDDGYEDFYTYGYPVLREFEIPATLYVTTGFIEKKTYLWPDELRALICAAQPGSYQLCDFWNSRQASFASDSDRNQLWHELAEVLVTKTNDIRKSALLGLYDSLNIDRGQLKMDEYLPLQWEQIKEMAANGIEIGDHTWSHSNLATLSYDDVIGEINRSMDCIKGRAGIAVSGLAYPNGQKGDFNDTVIQAVKDIGLDYAVTAVPTVPFVNGFYDIGRLDGFADKETFKNSVAGFDLVRI